MHNVERIVATTLRLCTEPEAMIPLHSTPVCDSFLPSTLWQRGQLAAQNLQHFQWAMQARPRPRGAFQIGQGSSRINAGRGLPLGIASSIRNGERLSGQPEKPQETSEINMGVPLALGHGPGRI